MRFYSTKYVFFAIISVYVCLCLMLCLSVCQQVCSLEFDRKDIEMNKLTATCLESKIHVFDVRTQHPQRGFASVTEKVTLT